MRQEISIHLDHSGRITVVAHSQYVCHQPWISERAFNMWIRKQKGGEYIIFMSALTSHYRQNRQFSPAVSLWYSAFSTAPLSMLCTNSADVFVSLSGKKRETLWTFAVVVWAIPCSSRCTIDIRKFQVILFWVVKHYLNFFSMFSEFCSFAWTSPAAPILVFLKSPTLNSTHFKVNCFSG